MTALICFPVSDPTVDELTLLPGSSCAHPSIPNLIGDFKDDFELLKIQQLAMIAQALMMKIKVQEKWESIEGGSVGYGGCGGLTPFGFGRTVYFSLCGPRWLQTVEMDLRKARYWFRSGVCKFFVAEPYNQL